MMCFSGQQSRPSPSVIEAEKAAPQIAKEAIALMRALYAVERQGSNALVEDRLRQFLHLSESCRECRSGSRRGVVKKPSGFRA